MPQLMNLYKDNDYHHPATFSSYILNDGDDEHLNSNTSPTMSDIHHNHQPTLSFTGNSSSEDDDEKFDDDEFHIHQHHHHQHHQEKKLQRNHSHSPLPDKISSAASAASSTTTSTTSTSIKNNNRHNNSNPDKGIGGNGGNDRLFICVLCERVFSRKEHAKRHCGKPKCIKKFIELAVEESATLDSSIDSIDYTALSTSKIASSPSSL